MLLSDVSLFDHSKFEDLAGGVEKVKPDFPKKVANIFKKIQWMKRKEVEKAFLLVLLAGGCLSVYISGIDALIYLFFSHIFTGV